MGGFFALAQAAWATGSLAKILSELIFLRKEPIIQTVWSFAQPPPHVGIALVFVMFRVGMISYLMLATLAGPAWCCCTLSQLAQAASLAVNSADSSTSSTCCHQGERIKPQKDQADSPADDPCPCKEQRSNHVPAMTAEGQALENVRLNSPLLDSFQLALSAAAIASCDGQSTPEHPSNSIRAFFTSGPDLLCALQVFRC